MNTDIRLMVSFKGHRKRKRLKSMIGPSYLDFLIDLWLTVAEDRPDGILEGWDQTEIALAAGYDGPAEEFCTALHKCGFLDWDGRIFKIHDWQDHQGWACGAKKRSLAAKENAKKRWDNKFNANLCQPSCGGNAVAMPSHQIGNAPSPSPSPSPSLKDKKQAAAAGYSKLNDMATTLYKRGWLEANKWLNTYLKRGKNEKAIEHVLNRLIQADDALFKEMKHWAYATGILQKENPTYNEADSAKQSQEHKDSLNTILKTIGLKGEA